VDSLPAVFLAKRGVFMTPCFLLSLPRSGSTLLERVLAQNEKIHAVGEPWISLMFPYALRKEGSHAEYSHSSFTLAMNHFVSLLPNKEADYYAEAGEMIQRLQQKIGGPDTQYFLDKTPRYHLILDELIAMFPTAKFIVLYRNPLAVAASIIETGKRGAFRFGGNEIDLYQGPFSLGSFCQNHRKQILTLRYEDFVSEPLKEYNRIMRFLSLPEALEIELPGKSSVTEAPLGDKSGVAAYKTISTSSVDKWVQTFCNPIRRRWAKDYLHFIASELLNMGYSEESLNKALRKNTSLTRHLLHDFGTLKLKAIRLLHPSPIQFSPIRARGKAKLRFAWK